MQDLLNKLDKLYSKFLNPEFPQDKELIQEWRKIVSKAILVEQLITHDGIKMFLEELKEDIKIINEGLLTLDSNSLNDIKRDRLLDKKKIYQGIIGFFTVNYEEIKGIEQKVIENEDFIKE